VADLLAAAEGELFWRQAPADQRHAYETMRRCPRHQTDRTVLAAALLHDVGKTLVDLGAVGRSLATIADVVRIPLRGRFATYRSHGALGAVLLETAGAAPLAIEFARRHPHPDPAGCDPVAWRILLEADNG